MRPVNVISLFDGKACARVALERAGIPVGNYYASEIDKYAMIIAKKNYPDIQHVGDVTKLQHVDWIGIDLLCGGSPCQGFSFAGKQLNFDDPRSALFFEFVRIWNEIKAVNPNAKFFLENVVMKQEYQDVISGLLGVKPVMVNSALVSAQNRKRLYWTNIEGFVMPEDKKKNLKDVLTESCITERNKSLAVIASSARTTHREYFCKNQGQMIFITSELKHHFDIKETSTIKVNYPKERKNISNSRPEIEIDGLTKSFTIDEFKNLCRKISCIEAERLQTLPDNYTQSVSDSQRYKMIGNGWTIDVIVEFFKNLKPASYFSENLDF